MTDTGSSYRTIRLFAHALSDEQVAQLDRALEHFHAVQSVIRLTRAGERTLTMHAGLVDFEDLAAEPPPRVPEIIATGCLLVDNWFTHTRVDRALLSVGDWQIAFFDHAPEDVLVAPDAHVLLSLVITTLMLVCRASDADMVHERTTGCVLDLCVHKPDRAIKMRAAFVCHRCRASAAAAGASAIEVDALQAVLDRVRALCLGRRPQLGAPATPSPHDEEFLRSAELPHGVRLPRALVEACKRRKLTACVGSGMSLQDDVDVRYATDLPWKALPTWGEIPDRLSTLLDRYRGRVSRPRAAETLREFLTDLDFFRAALGDRAYYPRAIFDVFAPTILSPGRANRLLFRLPLRWLLTTNYDFVLNYSAPPGTATYTWREARQAREYLERAANPSPPLIKLHGCASRPDTLVLTQSEYETMRQSPEYVALLNFIFDVQTLLFVGYGMNDPFDLDFALANAQLSGAAQGEKFALVLASKAAAIRERHPNVQVIPYSDHSDLPAIIAVLNREAMA